MKSQVSTSEPPKDATEAPAATPEAPATEPETQAVVPDGATEPPRSDSMEAHCSSQGTGTTTQKDGPFEVGQWRREQHEQQEASQTPAEEERRETFARSLQEHTPPEDDDDDSNYLDHEHREATVGVTPLHVAAITGQSHRNLHAFRRFRSHRHACRPEKSARFAVHTRTRVLL